MQVLPVHPVEQNVYIARPDPSELKVTAGVVTFPPLNIVRVAILIRFSKKLPSIRL